MNNHKRPSPDEIARAEKSEMRWFAAGLVWLIFSTIVTAGLGYMAFRTTTRRQELVSLDADARIAEANSSAAKANEQATRLSGDVAAQQQRAARAERDLLAVKERLADRALAPEQRSLLVTLLKSGTNARIFISCIGPQPEPCEFAQQCATAFHDAGWPLQRGNPSDPHLAEMIVGESFKGLMLSVRDVDKGSASAAARSVKRAFEQIGFQVELVPQPGMKDDELTFTVGFKP